VLAILIGVLTTLLVTRTEVEATILRTPGMIYQTNEDGTISNLYNYKIINKTNEDLDFTLKPLDDEFKIRMVGRVPELKMQEVAEGAFFLSAPPENFELGSLKTELGIFNAEGEMIEKVKIKMAGPL
jgi:polyferredoxin